MSRQGAGESSPPPPPSGGAEFSEAAKARKKTFDLNELPPKVREKFFDWPTARKKTFGPIVLGELGPGGGGGVGVWDPHPLPPTGAELLNGALPGPSVHAIVHHEARDHPLNPMVPAAETIRRCPRLPRHVTAPPPK